ncbi:MAG: hypothetical protein HOH33_07105 [Verrucomicrobia bacterium]|jgi:hypothetical protein|nr:hypothetical protein [Verrucomicrobiota bacterium]
MVRKTKQPFLALLRLHFQASPFTLFVEDYPYQEEAYIDASHEYATEETDHPVLAAS